MNAKLATLMIACSLLVFVPSVEAGHKACHDGVDNDGDGFTDYPNDPGCTSSNDNNEYNAPPAACNDGADNDSDGTTDYPNDPGCSSSNDSSERGSAQCDDTADNDSDGYNNYPADAGCSSLSDTTERTACQDSSDNDGDGATDGADPGCSSVQDLNERGSIHCDDGLDNDGDGSSDYPADSDCTGPSDGTEVGECADGIDNDGDGDFDYLPGGGGANHDYGCWSASDPSELSSDSCDDGLDNDGDGATDFPDDPGCSHSTDMSEPQYCSDGVDNDGDGYTDWPLDPGCETPNSDESCGGDGEPGGSPGGPSDPCTLYENIVCGGPCVPPPTPPNPPPGTQCSDGVDNDGDGWTDFPLDTDCSSATDGSEGHARCVAVEGICVHDCPTSGAGGPCSDVFWPLGLCEFNAAGDCEILAAPPAQCSDGVDNDGDGWTDWPTELGCLAPDDDEEACTYVYVNFDIQADLCPPAPHRPETTAN